ncbi:MAG TPA: NAD(P)H-dependent oxidoreductase [Candidatus Limnocylindrales bacterium]|nr:NAD(P)H-dependent oxidoreductase [Candidatus Limnocylindrales bacterium]
MVINGSVREGRAADKVQNWALEILKQIPNIELDLADLKEIELPFFNEPIIPSVAKGQYQNPAGTAWAKRVGEAEAFIMLTAEYNHGPTAVLKNAIDWVYEGWMYKPVGFISYGGLAAGTRAVQQLKQNVLNVKLFPALANIHIPNVRQAFNDQGQPVYPGLDENLKKLTAELTDLQKRLAG